MDTDYMKLLAAGYKPEQILSCSPCKCRPFPVKDCHFPTHRGDTPIQPPNRGESR